jgi:hypothetical protein
MQDNIYNTSFSSQITNVYNKIERLSLAGLSSLA